MRPASRVACFSLAAGLSVGGCSGQGLDGYQLDSGLDDGSIPPLPEPDATVCSGDPDAGPLDGCGKVKVDGVVNNCAKIGGYDLSPVAAVVGAEVTISAYAEDTEGDPATFGWHAEHGTFTKPNEATTTYRCDVAGEQLLKLTVSDSPDCVAETEVPVTCLSP